MKTKLIILAVSLMAMSCMPKRYLRGTIEDCSTGDPIKATILIGTETTDSTYEPGKFNIVAEYAYPVERIVFISEGYKTKEFFYPLQKLSDKSYINYHVCLTK